MALTLARTLVWALGAWVAIGIVFALAFSAIGAARMDKDARSGSFGFRILIFPASVALWPWLLWRWLLTPGAAPSERNAHRDRARVKPR